MGATYLHGVSALLLPWVQPGTTEDKTKSEEWAGQGQAIQAQPTCPAPSLESLPAWSLLASPGLLNRSRAPPGAPYRHKAPLSELLHLKSGKIMTDQILGVGVSRTEEETSEQRCSGPRPPRHFPSPALSGPLAELGQVKSLSPLTPGSKAMGSLKVKQEDKMDLGQGGKD